MNTQVILKELNKNKKSFNFYERRPGKHQLVSPILHEDGDMVDIYLQDSPQGLEYVRVCDFGLALQRLSYNYEINTDSKRKIFNSILFNNGVQNDNGNLYLDSSVDKLYEGILQFAGCVQKVCSMDYWSREIIHSAFYDNLKQFIITELTEFHPESDIKPLGEQKKESSIFKVDWSLKWNKREFYLFGVRGTDKAKDSTVTLLECKKAQLSFISLIVHEDMENLRDKDRIYLTRNADKQYTDLNDFKKESIPDIKRMAS